MNIKIESIIESVIAGLVILLIAFLAKKLLEWFVKNRAPFFEKTNALIKFTTNFFLYKGGIFIFPVGWGLYMIGKLLNEGPHTPADKSFVVTIAFYFSYIVMNFVGYLYSNYKYLKTKINILEKKSNRHDALLNLIETKAKIDIKFQELDKEIKKTKDMIDEGKKFKK